MTNPSRITKMRKRLDARELALLWNCVHPVGTPVALRLAAQGPEYASRTLSSAWVHCDGEPVVKVQGQPFPLPLRQVRALRETDAPPLCP
jgi:hypothetical protein